MTRPRPRWFPSAALAAAALLLVLALAGCQAAEEFASEGSEGVPVDLGAAPVSWDGQVGPDASSYYKVTVTASALHIVSITNLLDDADLAVYTDAAFTVLFCASLHTGTTNETCSATTDASTTVLYILIKPFTTDGTSYSLTAS